MFILEAYFHDRTVLPRKEVAGFWRCVNLVATFTWVQNAVRRWLGEVKQCPHQEEDEKGQLMNKAQLYQSENTFT